MSLFKKVVMPDFVQAPSRNSSHAKRDPLMEDKLGSAKRRRVEDGSMSTYYKETPEEIKIRRKAEKKSRKEGKDYVELLPESSGRGGDVEKLDKGASKTELALSKLGAFKDRLKSSRLADDAAESEKKHKDEVAVEEAEALAKLGSSVSAPSSAAAQPRQQGVVGVTFQPGQPIGVGLDEAGEVTEVDAGLQAEKLGVIVGWTVQLVDGAPFSTKILGQKVTGKNAYKLTFTTEADTSEVTVDGSSAVTVKDTDAKISFSEIWKEGDEESTSDWLNSSGLKFHTTADKAFAMESKRFKECANSSASDNREAIADRAKKLGEQRMADFKSGAKR